MKSYRLTWFDEKGNIHKVIIEGEEVSVDMITLGYYKYSQMVSIKELE